MTATAALGRGLFSFLFIASALEKWRALRVDGADAPIMTSVAPALRAVKATIDRNAGVNLCATLPSDYVLVNVATAIELLGGALFACGFALGAKMLILFTLVVTPTMNPFWTRVDESAALGDEAALGIEMIMFFKNVALIGALVFWLGMRSELSEAREALANRREKKRA